METQIEKHLDLLIRRYSILSVCREDIAKAYDILETCFAGGNKLLVAGNGGSCADAEHIVGELMKGFKLPRRSTEELAEKLRAVDPVRGEELAEKLQGGLPAIALSGHQGLNTAYINDVENGGLLMYAQQVNGYGKAGDVFLGISTSGNSKNVMYAAVVARAKGMKVLGLTGSKGGQLAEIAEIVPPVRLRHHSHPVAGPLKISCNDGRTERRMVHKGVTRKNDDVDVVPSQCLDLLDGSRYHIRCLPSPAHHILSGREIPSMPMALRRTAATLSTRVRRQSSTS